MILGRYSKIYLGVAVPVDYCVAVFFFNVFEKSPFENLSFKNIPQKSTPLMNQSSIKCLDLKKRHERTTFTQAVKTNSLNFLEF